jgi:dUTP pyrophosphatase
MRLGVRRLEAAARLPSRTYRHDAGLDLHALDSVRLAPGQRASVRTGIALEVPGRCAGLVLPRSGLAAAHGISLVNSPGLIDSGYRGEVRVLLLNTDRESAVEISAGDRIAQLVIVRVEELDVVELDVLEVSERAERGFGSSGR